MPQCLVLMFFSHLFPIYRDTKIGKVLKIVFQFFVQETASHTTHPLMIAVHLTDESKTFNVLLRHVSFYPHKTEWSGRLTLSSHTVNSSTQQIRSLNDFCRCWPDYPGQTPLVRIEGKAERRTPKVCPLLWLLIPTGGGSHVIFTSHWTIDAQEGRCRFC